MTLVDTSAWVEFDRATGSSTDARLTRMITRSEPIAVTEPVIMEVLAGARSDAREQELRRLLARFGLLIFDPISDFDGATRIYRACRTRGVTPRGIVDCMIVAVAQRYGASVLAHDVDFARVATVVGVTLDRASSLPRS